MVEFPGKRPRGTKAESCTLDPWLTLGIRDAGLLQRDGLPMSTFFHIDAREQDLSGCILSSQGPLYVGLAGDHSRVAIDAHLQIGKIVRRELGLPGLEPV